MIEMFIEKVERGLNEKTSLDYLDKKYEKGKLNKKELVRYQIALLDANEKKSGKVLEELNVQLNDEDKLQKEFWPILKKEVYGSEGFKFVLDHSDVLYKNVGKEQIDSYLMDNFFLGDRWSFKCCYTDFGRNVKTSPRGIGPSRYN